MSENPRAGVLCNVDAHNFEVSARVQTRLERDRRSPGLVRGHVRKEVARPVGLEAADLGLLRVGVGAGFGLGLGLDAADLGLVRVRGGLGFMVRVRVRVRARVRARIRSG